MTNNNKKPDPQPEMKPWRFCSLCSNPTRFYLTSINQDGNPSQNYHRNVVCISCMDTMWSCSKKGKWLRQKVEVEVNDATAWAILLKDLSGLA